jgi:hypothetical protein
LIKADEEMKRLRTELRQACDTAASEKQEMLQEVQRLTREWQNLSIAAAGDKQELIQEIRMLTDEHRKVAEATAVEKQDMHNEVLDTISFLSFISIEDFLGLKKRWLWGAKEGGKNCNLYGFATFVNYFCSQTSRDFDLISNHLVF